LFQIRGGLICLSQRILGPNTLVQGALPLILANTKQSFYDDTVNHIHRSAVLFHSAISKVPGLNPVMPQGAMYMMVCINIGPKATGFLFLGFIDLTNLDFQDFQIGFEVMRITPVGCH
jgi:aspartate/methionine/tyrosine aminotransferase